MNTVKALETERALLALEALLKSRLSGDIPTKVSSVALNFRWESLRHDCQLPRNLGRRFLKWKSKSHHRRGKYIEKLELTTFTRVRGATWHSGGGNIRRWWGIPFFQHTNPFVKRSTSAPRQPYTGCFRHNHPRSPSEKCWGRLSSPWHHSHRDRSSAMPSPVTLSRQRNWPQQCSRRKISIREFSCVPR